MEQEPLFDNKPYIDHHLILPEVVEIKPVWVENTGHDDFNDDGELSFDERPQ